MARILTDRWTRVEPDLRVSFNLSALPRVRARRADGAHRFGGSTNLNARTELAGPYAEKSGT